MTSERENEASASCLDAQRAHAAGIVFDWLAAHGRCVSGFDLSCLGSEGLIIDGKQAVSPVELDAVFECVSLSRELRTGRKDAVGRFDEEAIDWEIGRPWVDERLLDLARDLGHGHVEPKSVFRVIITHDVDRTALAEPTTLIKSLLQGIGLARNQVRLATALSGKTLAGTYERLLELERKRGVGAYYFMLSGRYGLGRHGSRTDIRWSASRRMLDMIKQAGMTVGLHGSYHARERDGYRIEKDRLEQVLGRSVVHHRNHYLRFDSTRICSQLEAAGIQYDFSVGFSQRLGFRAGCAHAYRGFDVLQSRPSGLVFVPLLFMDGLLFLGDRAEVLRRLRSALEAAKQVSGCVSLLFHPELFLVEGGFSDFFEEVLSLCGELGADLSGRLGPTDTVSRLPEETF